MTQGFGRSSMSTPPVRADAAACAGRDRPDDKWLLPYHLIGRTIVAVDDAHENHARLLLDNGDVVEFRADELLYRIHAPLQGNPDNRESFGHIWITAGNGTRWCEECGLVASPGEVAGRFDAPPCVKEREQ